MYNGYIRQIEETETILQYIYKGAIFIIALPYIFINNKYNKLLWALIILAVLSFCYWAIQGYIIDFKSDCMYLIKIFYAYFVMLFIVGNSAYITKKQLINYIILYGFIAALSIIVTAYFGVSTYKYSESFSFGFKGFFMAGNDMGLTLLLCNCLACCMYIYTSKTYYIIANLLISTGSILIGTVAGLYGSAFVMACFAIIGFFKKRTVKKWHKLYFIIMITLGAAVLFNTIKYITTIDSYNENKFSTERLLSGGARSGLTASAIRIIKSYNVPDMVFGRGSSRTYRDMGINLGYNTKAAEVDHYDLFCSYGLLLGGLFLVIPILIVVSVLKRFYKCRTPFYFWSFIALSLFLVHAFAAGHAYANPMAMPIVAAIAYCAIYNNKQNILIM
jgi:hypothetical protein